MQFKLIKQILTDMRWAISCDLKAHLITEAAIFKRFLEWMWSVMDKAPWALQIIMGDYNTTCGWQAKPKLPEGEQVGPSMLGGLEPNGSPRAI